MEKYEVKDGVGIIPEGTKEIKGVFGFRTFKDSESLTSVVIPDSVTRIGNYAFCDCSNLTSIIIPNSVTEIGIRAFDGCTSLESIVIPNSVTMIEGNAFCHCKSLTVVNIPDGVQAIGRGLFYECVSLKTISIPTSVSIIDEHAFHGCASLTSINIPDSVKTIGNCAFIRCTGLKNIIIPKSVKSIGESVFNYCEALQTATIFAPAILKSSLFESCSALETVTFGVGIKKIKQSAFYDCNSLKTINVPVNKGEYYCQLLSKEELQLLIKETELAGFAKPSAKKTSVKPAAAKEPTHPKNIYKVTFKCDCHEGICSRFVNNATPFDDLGYRMDFEQDAGKLEKDVKCVLFACCLYDMVVIEEATGKTLEIDDDPEQTLENWVEKKLDLQVGNRYYIQGMQVRYGGTFTKKITFKIETEGDFDIKKLSLIYDTTFDDMYWKIKNGEIPGVIINDVEPDEGLVNPYAVYYDSKIVKSNKVNVLSNLRGEAYMCFDWQKN